MITGHRVSSVDTLEVHATPDAAAQFRGVAGDVEEHLVEFRPAVGYGLQHPGERGLTASRPHGLTALRRRQRRGQVGLGHIRAGVTVTAFLRRSFVVPRPCP